MKTKIKQTNDYKTFTLMTQNRGIDQIHVNKLKKSIKQNDLTAVNPILVDHFKRILDGQHRFKACEQLKLPIHYIEVDTNAFDAITTLNTTQRNWGMADYARAHAKTGKQTYVNILGLIEEYKVSVTSLIAVLCSTTDMVARTTEERVNNAHLYKDGLLELPDKDFRRAKTVFNQQELLFPFSNNMKCKLLVCTLNKLRNHPEFNFANVVKQCEKYNLKITKQQSLRDYLRMFEDILNHRKSKADNMVLLYNPKDVK